MTRSIDTSRLPPSATGGRPLIGITMGDPGGIGPEVTVKALCDPAVRSQGRFLIFGIDDCLYEAAGRAGIKPFWFRVARERARRIDSGVVVADFDEFAGHAWSQRPSVDGGRASLAFLDEAIEAGRQGTIDAMVTGPIHKTSWDMAGCKHPGHTERLAEAFRTTRFNMAFVGGGMRLALATLHLGLFQIQKVLNIGTVFQPIDLLHDALRNWFDIAEPRIAVAGLNPHAGEGGRFGDEETRVIEPAIQMARNAGIDAEGPFSPDTMFLPEHRRRFDGIVAMYHDQGLIPIKLLAFHSAVNVTLGLPIIRTSVDHGTAFDIAGKDAADCGSMKEALRLARWLANNTLATTWSAPRAVVPGA